MIDQIKLDFEAIKACYSQFQAEGIINIHFSTQKEMSYDPLHDELGYETSQSMSTSVLLVKNHKKASYSLDGYSLPKVIEAIKALSTILEMSEYDEDIILPDVRDSGEKDFSGACEMIDFPYMREQFENTKNYPFQDGVSIESFGIGSLQYTHYFLNTLGSIKMQQDAHNYLAVELLGERDNQKETHYKHLSTKLPPMMTGEFMNEIETDLLHKLAITTPTFPSGTYDVVLDRDVVIDFLDLIVSNLSAELIREGVSLFSKNSVGDKIFGDNLTLINDPNLPGYTGNALFDGEGVTLKKTVLIENGVLRSKFYDYKNALKDGLEYLGNSKVTNICLEAEGNENILQGNAFLFTNLMAFHTVDTSTGKFSLNGEGYQIKDGKKQEFIRGISLSGNIVDLFSNIKAFGNDFRTDGNYKIPSCAFKNQKII